MLEANRKNLNPMNIKIVFALCLMAISSVALCQDKIYKRDGAIVTAIVKEVSDKKIVYKKYDNPNGPDYSMVISDIEKIIYQNGSEDNFGQPVEKDANRENKEDSRRKKDDVKQMNKIRYAKNILSIAPLQLSDNGIGIGASYERRLDKEGVVSFYLPVYLTWNTNNSNNYNNNTYTADPMFYVAPGIKIYPTGDQGKVKYAVGPNLVIATGSQTNDNGYYNNSGYYTYGYETRDSRFMMGIMVINSLNINPTPNLYLGLELGVGDTYINKTDGGLQQQQGLVEFSFRIGYRF